MIHEYFIEPSLIYKWAQNRKDAKKFFNEIGVGSSRILSSFPKSKASKLRGELIKNAPNELGEIARQRLDVFAESIAKATIKRDLPKNLPADWLAATCLEVGRLSPDIIMTSVKDKTHNNWIEEDDVYASSSIYDHQKQILSDRSLASLTGAVSNFLKYAREIILVEPYAYKDKGLETINAFINVIKKDRLSTSPITFKVIFNASKASSEHLLNKINFDGVDFKVEILGVEELKKGEKLHNRYLLSELGGVSFGVGTDAGEAYHTDEINLLELNIFQIRWDQYKDAAAFSIKDVATKN